MTCLPIIGSAQAWWTGSFIVHHQEGTSHIGEARSIDLVAPEVGDKCVFGALLEVQAGVNSEILLSGSNRLVLQFSGPGDFRVERFEQTGFSMDDWEVAAMESGWSRMRLFLRNGHLFVDSRVMSEASQLIVETPVGRLFVTRALWQIQIRYDSRMEIFHFEIFCSEGHLRFIDNQGVSYVLRGGQRLSGAGNRMNPGVEIVQGTSEARAGIENFRALVKPHRQAMSRGESYLSQMTRLPIGTGLEAFGDLEQAKNASNQTHTRVPIEHAPRARSLTPFRGEIRRQP